jgi:hypothetical protein
MLILPVPCSATGRFTAQAAAPPRPRRERVAELGGLPTSGAGERGSALVVGHCPGHALPPLPSSAISLRSQAPLPSPAKGEETALAALRSKKFRKLIPAPAPHATLPLVSRLEARS